MAVNTEPRIPDDVMRKLLTVTAAILILPVTTFFLLRYLGFNAIASGGTAAAVAQVLLIGYVVVAYNEKDPVAGQLESKKLQ